MNKRLLAGLAAAGIIGGGVYGFAASLDPVTSDTVAAGEDDVASCDADGVNVDYTVKWDTVGLQYIVDKVTVSQIANTCDGDDIQVTLLETDGTAGASEQTGVVLANNTTDTDEEFSFAGQTVSAHDLSDVHVVIAS